MRIQIASDLHLELREKQTFEIFLEPAAPVLALLGDVAPLDHPNLFPFLEWIAERWETILWIAGDAELGNEDPRTAAGAMRLLVRPFPNIQILDHEVMVSSDGVYVAGLSYFPPPRRIEGGAVWNPVRGLYEEPEPDRYPVKAQLAAYNADLAWLRRILQNQKEPIVILSYRGPVVWLQEEGFVGDPDKCITYPEMEQLLRPPLVAWLCGHVHQSALHQKEWNGIGGGRGAVLLAANPRGRLFENLAYRRDAVIRIDPKLYAI